MKHFFCLLLLLLLGACQPSRTAQNSAPVAAPIAEKAKNIILIIGDGLATAQATAGLYWKGPEQSVFRRFPVVGFHKSHAHDDLITDSAAGATAFACGQKTFNGAIGVLPQKNKPCRTILEELDARGYATGMVTSCSATHATPASFIAHREIRAFTEFIAEDYLNTDLDCFVGSGETYFTTERPDKRNLEDSLRKKGYVVKSSTNIKKMPLDGSAPFFMFTADRETETASAGRVYLPEATKAVCPYLQKRSPKGFFLMVEGSQIDWALHGNDRNWLKAELLDFDATVAAALDFAMADGNTLVLVTGDHECGGLALHAGEPNSTFSPKFATRLHTGAMVPVFAYGPKATLFSGIYDNTDIYWKMWATIGEKP